MIITKPAATAILNAMAKEGLDIKETAVSFEFVDGGVGFSFSKDTFGKEFDFHGLRVLVDDRIDTEKMIVDLGEVKGRVGLIFKGEENGSDVK